MRRGLEPRLSRKTEGLDGWLAGGLGNRLESNQRSHNIYNGHFIYPPWDGSPPFLSVAAVVVSHAVHLLAAATLVSFGSDCIQLHLEPSLRVPVPPQNYQGAPLAPWG